MHTTVPHLRALAAGAVAATVLLATGCTSSVDTRELDTLFSERLPDDEPGCAAAIYENGGVAWTGVRGLADVEEQLLITNDTVFDIGSLTMQFTATAALLLAERGELDLDDPLSSFLPDLPEWADQVTVDDLMHHTSGIGDYRDLIDRAEESEVGVAELLEAISAVSRLDPEPSTRFAYSYSNYLLLALVLEEVTGRPFPEVLEEEVLRPAGIEADVGLGEDVQSGAKPYFNAGGGAPVAEQWESMGDLGLRTTASELAEWGAQYWKPSVGGEELLRARTADAVFVGPEPNGDVWSWGAGLLIGSDDDGRPVLGDLSRTAGFSSGLIVFPGERLAAAVLCNHPEHRSALTARELLDAIIAED